MSLFKGLTSSWRSRYNGWVHYGDVIMGCQPRAVSEEPRFVLVWSVRTRAGDSAETLSSSRNAPGQGVARTMAVWILKAQARLIRRGVLNSSAV